MRLFWLLLLILIAACSSQKTENTGLPKIHNLGTQLNYNIYGDGDTTLFFVHGWCINQTYWNDQVDYFKDNYRIITLDLPGHGQSGKNRNVWSVDNFGSDISIMMEALSLNNVVLIGHSMGGNIILDATARNPQSVIGFVGVDNFKDVGSNPSEEEKVQVDQFFQLVREDYKANISQFAKGMLFSKDTPNKITDRVIYDILNTPADISISILENLWAENKKEILQMKELNVKVHLINCDGYPTNERQLAKYCGASYEVHPIGNLSHYPMIEDPEKFNDILERILKSL